METNKKFDTVQFMRNIREKLSERYWKHPDILKKDMQAIREKYNLRVQAPEDVIEQQISNRAIDADVTYSTINLSLFQNPSIRKEIIANYVISDYQLPFGQRLSNAIKDGWQYFLAFIIAFAHLWMFILLIIAIFISYRYLQQRKKLTIN